MMSERKIVVTADEAAEMLGMTRKEFYRIAGADDFPACFRVGVETCWLTEEVQAWADRQEGGGMDDL